MRSDNKPIGSSAVPANTAAIRLEALKKSFPSPDGKGQTVVFDDIWFDVAPGEFVCLIGHSGCGKTTFLKMLLGTEFPTRGNITIDGKPLSYEPDAERGIVFQRYSVFPHLTVLQNVLLAMEFEQSPFLSRLFGSARRAAQLTWRANHLDDQPGKQHQRERASDQDGHRHFDDVAA